MTTSNHLAPLTNVALCLTAVDRALNRPQHLPGLLTFNGPSGYGKSLAALHAAHVHRGYYVEAKSTWNTKWFLLAILREMGIQPARTIAAMADQASEQMALSGRPLFIDQMDYIVDKGYASVVMDLFEGSHVVIMMIGEELLATKLKAWERLHGRISNFVPAQPADLEDARHLRKFYVKRVQVKDCLLEHVHQQTDGSVRRICTNLADIEEKALREGKKVADREWWGDRPLFKGDYTPRLSSKTKKPESRAS